MLSWDRPCPVGRVFPMPSDLIVPPCQDTEGAVEMDVDPCAAGAAGGGAAEAPRGGLRRSRWVADLAGP
jgi:hypothetical protein